jgi:hypothetical protein
MNRSDRRRQQRAFNTLSDKLRTVQGELAEAPPVDDDVASTKTYGLEVQIDNGRMPSTNLVRKTIQMPNALLPCHVAALRKLFADRLKVREDAVLSLRKQPTTRPHVDFDEGMPAIMTADDVPPSLIVELDAYTVYAYDNSMRKTQTAEGDRLKFMLGAVAKEREEDARRLRMLQCMLFRDGGYDGEREAFARFRREFGAIG